MNNEIKNYGFIAPEKLETEEYVLGAGSVPQVVLQEDGDWEDSLPEGEIQKIRYIETCNCTAFATTNQIEQYERKAFGENNNYSDRWLGIIAGTRPPGNDPQKVYEAIRKYGLIPEEMLPFSDDIETVEDYFSFKGADKEACYRAGREWLSKKKFMHEWVFRPEQPTDEKINNMKVALRYSPLALSVYAWSGNEEGMYISLGSPNHWTSEYAYPEIVQYIFDSYEPFKKAVDQPILFCKRIHIEKIDPTTVQPEKKSCAVVEFFNNLFKR